MFKAAYPSDTVVICHDGTFAQLLNFIKTEGGGEVQVFDVKHHPHSAEGITAEPTFNRLTISPLLCTRDSKLAPVGDVRGSAVDTFGGTLDKKAHGSRPAFKKGTRHFTGKGADSCTSSGWHETSTSYTEEQALLAAAQWARIVSRPRSRSTASLREFVLSKAKPSDQ